MTTSGPKGNLSTGIDPALAAFTRKAVDVASAIGEEALELVIALLAMILVERAHGQAGLGIFAYLSSCLYVVRYMAAFSVPRFVEREMAVHEDEPRKQQRIMGMGFQAVVLTGIAASALLLLTAGFDTDHTQIEERFAAYVILAMVIPLANLNQLKLAILQGLGRHTRVAQLRMMRHVVFLGFLFVLANLKVWPSLLLIAFLPAELIVAVLVRRTMRAPSWWRAFRQIRRLPATLKLGYPYLFTDNALDILLNIDLFVLGLFVNAWDLGVYAEAAVLVRMALLVPVSVKPIMRRRYGLFAAHHQPEAAARLLRRTTMALFCLNVILALYTLLHFSAVLDFFFVLKGEQGLSFKVFLVFIPGMIFYGAYSMNEPIYEADGRVADLKQLTFTVFAVNLGLTLYLTPMVGVVGAAAATMVSMLIYFYMFGRHLRKAKVLNKSIFLVGGLAAYLIYMLFRYLSLPASVTVWLVPLIVLVLFYLSGFFGVSRKVMAAK